MKRAARLALIVLVREDEYLVLEDAEVRLPGLRGEKAAFSDLQFH